ncbi:hypothetical protein QYF36_011465 [Acer negundo]|nr:hypothetical protein QYF36_011465 [Acer negundo]
MYTLYVNLNSQELELGSIDPDYFSLYMLWEAAMGEAGKDFNPQHDKCISHAYLPWSGEMRLVESDSDMLEVFYQFGQHDTYIIHFDIEPLSLNGHPPTAPILQSSDDVDVFVEQEHGSGSEEDDKDKMSDIESEDEPQTPVRSSDDDSDTDKSAHSCQIIGRVFRENQGGRITLEVGMLFNDLEHFRQGNSRNVVSKSSQPPTRTMSYEVGNSSNTVVGMSSQLVASVTQHESQEMEAPFSQQYVYGAGENTTTNAEDNPSFGQTRASSNAQCETKAAYYMVAERLLSHHQALESYDSGGSFFSVTGETLLVSLLAVLQRSPMRTNLSNEYLEEGRFRDLIKTLLC